MVFRRIVILALLTACFFAPGCRWNPIGGNGEGIAGFGPANGLNYDNARVSCNYLKEDDEKYNVHCQALAVDGDGNEHTVDPTGLSPDLLLNWEIPRTVAGSDPVDLSCQTDPKGLQQSCSVTINPAHTSTIQFTLDVQKPSLQQTRVESAKVVLPVTALTFGLVPQLPEYLVSGGAGTEIGIHIPSTLPVISNVGVANYMCFSGDELYVTVANSIYLYRAGQMRLFAGSGNFANTNEFSHRLRVALTDPGSNGGAPPQIACAKDAIYAADTSLNRVLRLDKKGPVTLVAGTGVAGFSGDGGPGEKAMLSSPRSVALGPDGTVYIADANNHRVRMVSPKGIITTLAGGGGTNCVTAGVATNVCLGFPDGITVAKDGSVFLFDAGLGQVVHIKTAGYLEPFLGGGKATSVADGGNPLDLHLTSRILIAADPVGNLYLTDNARHVAMVTPEGKYFTVLGLGANTIPDSGSVPASTIGLEPASFAFNPDGLLYMGDWKSGGTFHRTPDNLIVMDFKGFGDDVRKKYPLQISEMRFVAPSAVRFGHDGSLYVADTWRGGLTKIDPQGKEVSVALGVGLVQPTGIHIDQTGTFFVSDQVGLIERMGASETKSTLLIRDRDIPNIPLPAAITVDGAGTIYFSDSLQHAIYRLTTDGVVTRICGNGTPGYSGDGGPAISAQINSPRGLVILKDGSLVFSDSANQRLRKIAPSGMITTIAGTGSPGISPDGQLATASKFRYPAGLAVTTDGKIYLADSRNSRIAQLTPNADGNYVVHTIAGNSVNKDCSGAIVAKVGDDDLINEVRASLSTLCYGEIVAVDVTSCVGDSAKSMALAFAQKFGGVTGNVVKLTLPCE